MLQANSEPSCGDAFAVLTASTDPSGSSPMLRSVFILSILVPGLAMAFRSRYAALVLYLWFALFRPQDWLWIDITSLRMSMVLGLLLVVPALATGLIPNLTHPISIGMILFVVSTVVSQVGAVNPATGWIWIDFMFRLVLTCLMVVTLSRDSKRVLGVLAVVAGSLGFHAAKAGLAFLLGGGMRFADGLAGAFVDNNGYALGTVMIMPLLLATAQNVKVVYEGRLSPWIARGFYAAVPLCMFAVIGTYSRGGFVALSAAAFAFVLLQRRRFTAVAVLLGVVSAFLAVVPIPQSYIDRLQTIQTYEKVGDDSAASRPHFWRVGMLMVADHPMGVGLKQYEAAYDNYDFTHGRYGHHRAVHSSHVQVLAELGYLGAAAWAGTFAYAFFACLRVRARSRAPNIDPHLQRFLFTTANALLTSMTAFVVGGAFLSLALNDITWLTFGIVAALDRVSIVLCREPAARPATAITIPAIPLAFRAVGSYSTLKGVAR
jgi:putative inorganic carbon (HCO3(-)) transporter